MTLFQELLDAVDRMEARFSIADAELQTALCGFDGHNDAAIRAAALECENAYNAVVSSQVDVDIYLESYELDLAGN